jgi:cytochrome c553
MATAAAHHAMTAGSIILLDVTRGIDGLAPVTRLTPDALFPESETTVLPGWHEPTGAPSPPPVPLEAKRWPGHCYRSPYPLSEKYFLAAYSFDSLIGEPQANPANMFGVYLVDAWGNKELLYRDPDISSLWPMPLAARPRPPIVPSVAESQDERGNRGEGTLLLKDVCRGWPALPKDTIKRLRIVQVLPKSTPHINEPPVGVANASPGRQVLGTVPVEADGSAWFRAPAGIALAFQALDERGQAVQMMRSITYLQPGETAGCTGCHELRSSAPPGGARPRALGRPPSAIEPAPDGSKPFSYPILVQPVLDKKCVSCHGRTKPAGGIVLTGEPEGHYTASYNALAPRVPYSAWQGGDFLRRNSEPVTMPGYFGARGSRLMKLLLDGHYGVALTAEEIQRLATWMDTNALFYGTFDPADQARQQRGQRIAGPALQ